MAKETEILFQKFVHSLEKLKNNLYNNGKNMFETTNIKTLTNIFIAPKAD